MQLSTLHVAPALLAAALFPCCANARPDLPREVAPPADKSSAKDREADVRLFVYSKLTAAEKIRNLDLDSCRSLDLWVSREMREDPSIQDLIDTLNDAGLDGPINWNPAPLDGIEGGEVGTFRSGLVDGGIPDAAHRELFSGTLWEAGVPYAWDHMYQFEIMYYGKMQPEATSAIQALIDELEEDPAADPQGENN